MKGGLKFLVFLSLILILSLTFVSAGFFGNLWSKVTGKAISTDSTGVDLTPRISYWWGKVNQHTENGVWMTDPDGTSGANLDKFTYCQKWYPNTVSVKAYKIEVIDTWRNAGNTGGPYTSTRWSYECVGGSECSCPSDGNACTTDLCSNNVCVHQAIAGCCTSGAECEDGVVCTTDSCVNNACVHDVVAGCCLYNSQCDDGSFCTTDSCVNNACTHKAINICANNDGCCPSGCSYLNDNDCVQCRASNQETVCNDNDVCTTDTCQNNVCVHRAIDNCCTSSAQCNDNDVCTTDICSGNVCTHVLVPKNQETVCNDNDVCTTDICSGNVCTHVLVPNCSLGGCQRTGCPEYSCMKATCESSGSCSYAYAGCINNDGCCTPGCNQNNDNDCAASVPVTCTDTDGGINYYIQGDSTDSTRTLIEGCVAGTQNVREFYCGTDGRIYNEDYTCPNGCKDGACIKPVGKPCLVDATNCNLEWKVPVCGTTTPSGDGLQEFCEVPGNSSGSISAGFSFDNIHSCATTSLCPNGCKDGACIQSSCTDSDEGVNYGVKGEVLVSVGEGAQIYLDYCINSGVLNESYCEGNTPKTVTHDCGGENKICSSGACVYKSRVSRWFRNLFRSS